MGWSPRCAASCVTSFCEGKRREATGEAENSCSPKDSQYSASETATPLTAETVEQHNEITESDNADEIKDIVKRMDQEARELGFELPSNWKAGSLDGQGKPPMKRWLEMTSDTAAGSQ